MKTLKNLLILTLIMVVLSGCVGQKNGGQVQTPVPTPTVTVTAQATPTPISEVTPTGNVKSIKLDSKRGFNPVIQTINPGDEIVWNNAVVDTVTLVSDDGLFNNQTLTYDREYRTIFQKIGTYKFHLGNNTNLNGTVIVEAPPKITPTPASTGPKELLPNSIFVNARMLNPTIWGPGKYELTSLKVDVTNQLNEKLTINAQILGDNQVLEERLFTLNQAGSSYQFSNEKTYFINSTNVSLRLLINGYQPLEYSFDIANNLS
ncbi:Uncharacterised protein [uncultured archaeon]|nr:Uncharacterised protein [uncultured archaeon]